MMQQFAAAAVDPALGHTILPGTADRRPHRPEAHPANRDGNFGAVLCVVIEEQKLGCGFVRKCLTQLLHNPGTSRMARYIEVEDTSPVVFQNKETVEHSEGDGWH